MYCRNCGSEIPNEARFCSYCGTETIAPKEPFAQEGQNAVESTASAASTTQVTTSTKEQAESIKSSAQTSESQTPNSLKAAVQSNKKRSRRHIPMILLVALALALATSMAFAAHYIYTNVWLPAQQKQQISTINSEDNQNNIRGQSEFTSSGNPDNILQLGEILSMEPDSIASFLEQQGMDEGTSIEDGEETFLPKNLTSSNPLFTVWRISDISNLDKDGKYLSQIGFGYESAVLEMGIGSETTTNPYAEHQYTTADELKSGKIPSSIIANNLGLKNGLSDSEIAKFTNEICKLGSPLARHSFSAHYSRGLYTQQVKTYSGFEKSGKNGQRYVWYLNLYDNQSDGQESEYPPSSQLVYIAEDNAYSTIIKPSELYTKEQWSTADDKTKATMIASSVAQESFIRSDTCRLNVLTGKVETRTSANTNWNESKTTDTPEDIYGLDRDSVKIDSSNE